MIPLFTVPGPDGRTTERHAEGAVHGEAAEPLIAGKIQRLLRP